jgi:hypothetical protein
MTVMTQDTATRPPQPAPPGKGLEYAAVPDPEWRVAAEGATCRHASPGTPACGEPAVAAKSHLNDPISKRWAYCARHALEFHKHWAEDGRVLHWVLRRPDGTVLTQHEAARALRNWRGPAGWCKKHECPPCICPPESGHLISLRARADLRDDAGDAAAADGIDASTWIREAMQARLNYLRCGKCRETDPPVPLEFGDLTGRPMDEWIAEAVERVRRQHPRHEPVTVGAEAPAPLAHPGVVPFRSPAVKP